MIQNPSDLTLSITKKKVHFLNFKSSPILIQLLAKEGITTSILIVIQVFQFVLKQNKMHHQKTTVSIFYRFSFCGFRPRSKAATHKGENAHKITFQASKKLDKRKKKTFCENSMEMRIKLERKLGSLHFSPLHDFPSNLTSNI